MKNSGVEYFLQRSFCLIFVSDSIDTECTALCECPFHVNVIIRPNL